MTLAPETRERIIQLIQTKTVYTHSALPAGVYTIDDRPYSAEYAQVLVNHFGYSSMVFANVDLEAFLEAIQVGHSTHAPVRWIPVTEVLPPNSSRVLVTDGKTVDTAHFYGIIDTERAAKGYGCVGDAYWGGRSVVVGSWVEKPTHWMPCDNLLKLPFGV